jgi:presenilin-like A22 family membrane protease
VYSEPLTGRPELEAQDSFTFIVIMILIGTGLLLLLIKFQLFKIWKAWFFLAVMGALSISFSVLTDRFPNGETIAIGIGFILAYLKLYRPNIFIHNFTEVFMYAGITILMSPLFTVYWMIMLLIVISIYDAIAVWKSKHMITLAKAQADKKMFAGLLIPYSKPNIKDNVPSKPKIHIKIPKSLKQEEIKSAILGGGDIAFPLLFAGSVMTELIQSGLSKEIAFFQALLVSLAAGIALFILLIKSKKDKFYPAMPFISLGCFVGYGLILIMQSL